MKTFLNRSRFLSIIVTVSLLVSQCGKVTQEIDAKDGVARQSFEIQTKLVLNQTILDKMPTESRFQLLEPSLMVTVLGIVEENRPKRLAWGQIELDEIMVTESVEQRSTQNPSATPAQVQVTKNVITFNTYNQSGIEIQKPNLYEAMIKFGQPTANVSEFYIDATKIKLGYSMYILAAYAGPQKYQFYRITQKVASDNAVVLYEELTEYDTFITTLFLSHISDHLYAAEVINAYDKLAELYTKAFFEQLTTYKRPMVIQKDFNIKDPYFSFDSPFEDRLLFIYDLVNLKEYELIAEEIKKLGISKQASELLLAHIDAKYINAKAPSSTDNVTQDQESPDANEYSTDITDEQ